ncbi:hypothetical protein [Nocardia sp. NPDC057227]|uniref:hypothetical protein n=1 Tax=Nocardia sp. NPDC057227 TaxID=3346056 RepID=UPI0036347505
MSEQPKPPTGVNPVVAKAAAGIRKRRRKVAPMPSFAPTPGQLELFPLPTEGDQP